MDKRFELNEKGMVTKEIGDGYQVPVSMSAWKDIRYYVKRDGKQIGWIATDLSRAEGTSSTHTFWLNQMLEAMRSAK